VTCAGGVTAPRDTLPEAAKEASLGMNNQQLPAALRALVRVAAVKRLLLAVCLLSCGPEPALDPNKLVRNLSDDEVRQLCDWGAGQAGGYGTRDVCDGGTYTEWYKSQQECVDSLGRTEKCIATVGDMQTCYLRGKAERCQSTRTPLEECRRSLTCGR
jgi:hypothetical protein